MSTYFVFDMTNYDKVQGFIGAMKVKIENSDFRVKLVFKKENEALSFARIMEKESAKAMEMGVN